MIRKQNKNFCFSRNIYEYFSHLETLLCCCNMNVVLFHNYSNFPLIVLWSKFCFSRFINGRDVNENYEIKGNYWKLDSYHYCLPDYLIIISEISALSANEFDFHLHHLVYCRQSSFCCEPITPKRLSDIYKPLVKAHAGRRINYLLTLLSFFKFFSRFPLFMIIIFNLFVR